MPKSLILFALLFTSFAFACGSEQKPASPIETFKTYTKALRKKDTTAMKLLLSSETLKAHEQEAKAMGTTVDDIVKRESIVSESQTAVEFRNEKIDGDHATLEVKNSFGQWETVFFLFENGEWKIDKKGYADQLLREVEEDNRKADEQNNINTGPPIAGASTPLPNDNVNVRPDNATNSLPAASNTNASVVRERRMPTSVERPESTPLTKP